MGVTPSWVRIPLPAPVTNPRGVLGAFGLWLKKQGFKDGTTVPMLSHLRILGNRADLDNPGLVKETIGVHPWSDGFKRNLSYAYQHLLHVRRTIRQVGSLSPTP